MKILTRTHRNKQSQHPSQTPIMPIQPSNQTALTNEHPTNKQMIALIQRKSEYVDKIMKSREKYSGKPLW